MHPLPAEADKSGRDSGTAQTCSLPPRTPWAFVPLCLGQGPMWVQALPRAPSDKCLGPRGLPGGTALRTAGLVSGRHPQTWGSLAPRSSPSPTPPGPRHPARQPAKGDSAGLPLASAHLANWPGLATCPACRPGYAQEEGASGRPVSSCIRVKASLPGPTERPPTVDGDHPSIHRGLLQGAVSRVWEARRVAPCTAGPQERLFGAATRTAESKEPHGGRCLRAPPHTRPVSP